MSDTLRNLRTLQKVYEKKVLPSTAKMYGEAAEEIERLRASLAKAVQALELARSRIVFLGTACHDHRHYEANIIDFLPIIDAVLQAVASPERGG